MQIMVFIKYRRLSNQKVYGYLSCAEYVSTFPLTSSNSTNPGHFSDSDSKRGKPASGLPRRMYLTPYMKSMSIKEHTEAQYTVIKSVQIIHTLDPRGSAFQGTEVVRCIN